MILTAAQAGWFLIAALPVSLYVAFMDMKALRIPNPAVYALALGFVVLGLIALPFSDYLWRFVHLAVALVAGMALNALRLLGAGDAKFIAAAAPYVAVGDLGMMAWIAAAAFLGAFLLHRILKHSPFRRLTPDWVSWTSGKRFPMGMALGLALIAYLLLGLIRPDWLSAP